MRYSQRFGTLDQSYWWAQVIWYSWRLGTLGPNFLVDPGNSVELAFWVQFYQIHWWTQAIRYSKHFGTLGTNLLVTQVIWYSWTNTIGGPGVLVQVEFWYNGPMPLPGGSRYLQVKEQYTGKVNFDNSIS